MAHRKVGLWGNFQFWFCTPLKINMEPKHHPIEKESHLPNIISIIIMLQVNFPGCNHRFNEPANR